jgi:hypothetical protein
LFREPAPFKQVGDRRWWDHDPRPSIMIMAATSGDYYPDSVLRVLRLPAFSSVSAPVPVSGCRLTPTLCVYLRYLPLPIAVSTLR